MSPQEKCLPSKILKIINADENAWKINPYTLLVGINTFNMEISMEVSQKTKNRSTI